MTKVINTVIKLRKDNEANYLKVGKTFIPADGEVCLVSTEMYGVRQKIGDGKTSFEALPYLDENNNVVLIGYYFNEKFYTDSTYTKELMVGETHIYLDKNSNNNMYVYEDGKFHPINPMATETLAGIMKLYQTHGDNVDGTMSQKVITDGVNSIKLDLDGADSECLILDLPWD